MAIFYATDNDRNSAIERKLSGRLEFSGGGSTLGRTPLDSDLVNQVASQAEEWLATGIKSAYAWPLQKPQRVTLQEIVEDRAVCKLIMLRYYGQSPSNEGNDYGRSLCKQAEKALNDLLEGKIVLDGELKPNQPQPSVFTRSVTKQSESEPVNEIEWADATPSLAGTRTSTRREVGCGF